MNHIKYKQKENELKRKEKEKRLESLKAFQQLEEQMNRSREN